MIKQHLRCAACVAIAIGATACDSSRATDPLNEPLLSVDDCPETAIVECEDEPGANSSVIKFLDYQDNENLTTSRCTRHQVIRGLGLVGCRPG